MYGSYPSADHWVVHMPYVYEEYVEIRKLEAPASCSFGKQQVTL